MQRNENNAADRRLAFITNAGYLPQNAGGAQWATHELLEELHAAGWSIRAIVADRQRRTGSLHRAWRKAMDVVSGPTLDQSVSSRYTIERYAKFTGLVRAQIARGGQPRQPLCVMTDLGVGGRLNDRLRLLAKLGAPKNLLWLHSASKHDLQSVRDLAIEFRLVVGSRFIASLAEEVVGVTPFVLHPMPAHSLVEKPESQGKYITLVNIHEAKGAHLLPAIARAMPEQRFLAIEGGWPDSNPAVMLRALRDVPNITVVPNTKSMDEVYARTRVLLAPSQVPEAFGRVVPEAFAFGVPVVSSALGAAPEIVSGGGLLVSQFDSPQAYVDCLRRLLEDSESFAAYRRNTRRVLQQLAAAKQSQLEDLLKWMEAPVI